MKGEERKERTYLTFHMFVSRSTSCLPDMSIASTLKTAQMKKKNF